jgi:hypothetical protein
MRKRASDGTYTAGPPRSGGKTGDVIRTRIVSDILHDARRKLARESAARTHAIDDRLDGEPDAT